MRYMANSWVSTDLQNEQAEALRALIHLNAYGGISQGPPPPFPSSLTKLVDIYIIESSETFIIKTE